MVSRLAGCAHGRDLSRSTGQAVGKAISAGTGSRARVSSNGDGSFSVGSGKNKKRASAKKIAIALFAVFAVSVSVMRALVEGCERGELGAAAVGLLGVGWHARIHRKSRRCSPEGHFSKARFWWFLETPFSGAPETAPSGKPPFPETPPGKRGLQERALFGPFLGRGLLWRGVSGMPPLRPCLGLPGMPCRGLARGANRCPPCRQAYTRARDAHRGSTTQRGLGAAHRAQVEALIEACGGVPTHCPRCSRPINKGNPITGQHDQARAHGGKHVTSLLCRACNSSLGARIRRITTL